MITLYTDRLRVEISEPGERPNDGTRFDRSGFVTEIVLDGAMRFCASEPQNLSHPSSGGRGLCNEYFTDYSAEAKPGERYPKFGIGLIAKEDDEPYRYYKRYEDVQEFPVHSTYTSDAAVFVTEPLACMGYAMRTQKTVRVAANTLTIEVEAQNAGEKTIEMREYCHNFLSVDGMAINPGYRLEFPALRNFGTERMLDINGLPCNWRGNGKGFTYCESSADVAHIAVDLSGMVEGLPFVWRLANDGAKAFVEVSEFFLPQHLEVWSVDHMVSPEVFHQFTLEPGATHRWKRSWVFDVY